MLSVLRKQNVLHPDLLKVHFDMFVKMSDKEMVAQYLKQCIQSCANFGYTSGINIQLMTTMLRRIYKRPEDVEMSQLLDFLVMLAIS